MLKLKSLHLMSPQTPVAFDLLCVDIVTWMSENLKHTLLIC